MQFIEVNSDPKGRIGVLMLHHTYAGPSASCAGPIANSLCNPGHADMPMCMQQNSRHEYPAVSLTAILCQCFWENNFINIYMCVYKLHPRQIQQKHFSTSRSSSSQKQLLHNPDPTRILPNTKTPHTYIVCAHT